MINNYIYWDSLAASKLIDLIDDLLELGGSGKDSRDIFDINMKPSHWYHDYYRQLWDNSEIDYNIWPEEDTDENVRKLIEAGYTDYCDPSGVPYPLWDGVSVMSKDIKHTRLSKKIMDILDMQDTEYNL